MADRRTPLVFLVGAGPGDPGLLTLRAAECLAQADLVLYDRLVPARCLDLAPPAAERVCVTELADRHVERCSLVHDTLIAAAREGKRVVRLKGGDPFVFGRGGEEAEALRQAGIPYEVVPGVTSGLAAAACAGIPLTHRDHASAVALVTGHENPAKQESALDWSLLARFPGTLVIYMGIAHLPKLVHALVAHGKPADTPAAAVQWATTADQRTVEAPLGDLAAAVRAAGLAAPAIVLVGPVVALRPRLAWFERRPLFGKRVLLTRPLRGLAPPARPGHQADDLAHRLEQLGAATFNLPLVEIREPADWAPVDRALASLSQYSWLVFTSANGVHAVIRRLQQTGRDLRALGPVRLAAIGPATADALRGYHLEPDLVPPEYRSESLAAVLRERAAGQRILLARADRGRELLREELSAVAEVDQVTVYAQVDAVEPDPHLLDCLRRGEIDYVTVTSSNVARALARALDAPCRARIEAGQVQLVSISPVTSAVVRELGLPVAAEAAEYTAAGVAEALVALAQRG
ncbi:MAG TPA: uroporphyrinogen-III C-methyltransferase [Gemmataceae bacterium]|jgi:uroporphyrinogen III methyltransferase/synthase|nr:uroporphyrinogen-III C-methyltransferase [Gemmataceae bacterium]